MPKVVLSRAHPAPSTSAGPFPALVRAVAAGSPAERAGVRAGHELLWANGRAVPDILAYRHALEGGETELELRDPATDRRVRFTVAWEEPGLEFEEVLFDGLRLCANKCDFCYIHQMPKGMRKSLYLMDDDFRTSFLYGSFVTLTNLSEHDIERILEERLSPLYVSVHATDEGLRGDLMKWWPHKVPTPGATDLGALLDRLEPIDLYTQVVVLPGRNDGAALSATFEALAARPNVRAVAAVPVGLTAHRTHLPSLEPHTPAQAADVIARVERAQRRRLADRGTRFVFASDEFYLRAGLPLPEADAYEGFPMLENGVGMVRDFLSEPLPEAPAAVEAPLRVIVVSGTLFAPTLRTALAPLSAVDGLDLEVRPVANRTFGDVTTVAGLLAGRDVLHAVAPGEADLLLLSPNMLKFGTETLLDDRTLSDLRTELRMTVEVGGTTLGELGRAIVRGAPAVRVPSFGFSTHAVKEAAKRH